MAARSPRGTRTIAQKRKRGQRKKVAPSGAAPVQLQSRGSADALSRPGGQCWLGFPRLASQAALEG